MFVTAYSQETLEKFKSLIHEDKLLKKIKGFVVKNKWIYFTPIPFDRITKKKKMEIIGVRVRLVNKTNKQNFIPFEFK